MIRKAFSNLGSEVALYMSAWIEIRLKHDMLLECRVALYMSAWIEIAPSVGCRMFSRVALYMSAWIEIAFSEHVTECWNTSHST